MKQISKGAEAEIFLDNDIIIKKRVVKNYRYPALDAVLRKSRTRREAKIISRLPIEANAPRLLKSDDEKMELRIEYIKGSKVRDILDEHIGLCTEIGKIIAHIHNSGIIHGDLTTSNMLYDGTVRFIDFGLSFFSEKVEDKAVDLHLLRQALDSKHYKISEKAFNLVLDAYLKNAKDSKEILKRYKVVESRGRNKAKF